MLTSFHGGEGGGELVCSTTTTRGRQRTSRTSGRARKRKTERRKERTKEREGGEGYARRHGGEIALTHNTIRRLRLLRWILKDPRDYYFFLFFHFHSSIIISEERGADGCARATIPPFSLSHSLCYSSYSSFLCPSSTCLYLYNRSHVIYSLSLSLSFSPSLWMHVEFVYIYIYVWCVYVYWSRPRLS